MQECFFLQVSDALMYHGSCNGMLLPSSRDPRAQPHPVVCRAFTQVARSLKLGGVSVVAQALSLCADHILICFLGASRRLYQTVVPGISAATSHWNRDIGELAEDVFDKLLDYCPPPLPPPPPHSGLAPMRGVTEPDRV